MSHVLREALVGALINVLSNLLGQQLLLQAINLPKHVQMEEVGS